jgi:hypothetical protein
MRLPGQQKTGSRYSTVWTQQDPPQLIGMGKVCDFSCLQIPEDNGTISSSRGQEAAISRERQAFNSVQVVIHVMWRIKQSIGRGVECINDLAGLYVLDCTFHTKICTSLQL